MLFPIPFSFHTPATNQAVPLLALLTQHSTRNLSPQVKSISRCNVNKHLSEISAAIFCLSVSLHSNEVNQERNETGKFYVHSSVHRWYIFLNNCPTRCNTQQSIYYSASSLYMFRVLTTPIIRSTQNCNYSLRYWSYFLCSYLPATWPKAWPRRREVAAQYRRL